MSRFASHQESIFSDLNNLDVVTTTSDEYAVSFGFTQDEVSTALDNMGLGSEKDGVRQRYDGFTFGVHTDIYNPWFPIYQKGRGICRVLGQHKFKRSCQLPDLRRERVCKADHRDLIRGGSFTARIDEQIVFSQLEGNEDAVCSLLLATGYLKVLQVEVVGEDKQKIYTLNLTNKEVSIILNTKTELIT